MLASGGPPLVEAALGMKVTKEELGGTAVHLASGVVDNFVADDAAAIAQVRQYLSYMPQSCYQRPPTWNRTRPPCLTPMIFST